ncbi:hypothetical protein MJD09_09355 [bacterium]|nr:hypothetical protein [bacterium]
MRTLYIHIRFFHCALLGVLTTSGAWGSPSQDLVAALNRTHTIAYPANGAAVSETVALALQRELLPEARLVAISNTKDRPDVGVLFVGAGGAHGWRQRVDLPEDGPWMFARIEKGGGGVLRTSHPNFLYALFELVKEQFADPGENLLMGILRRPRFRWITGRDDVHLIRLGYLKRRQDPVTFADIEASFKEVARVGGTHVIVNEPASRFPYETGPDGEMYYRFYSYAGDFDQYVETKLNKGTYPRDYRETNLALLKRISRLAAKYGLTPGMYIANPRSVPESLLEKYPFLRGARVDHTFRSFRPRYTLTLAHPAVRWHYAEMLRKLLEEVPELGFVITLINDSGSGFEYTASLYPGRNGGPYVVREWRPDDEIARAAAENVVRYYRVLRDAAHETHPDFRIITGLKNIAEEAEIILDGLDNGIDRRLRSQRSDYDPDWHATMEEFQARGSYLYSQASATGSPQVLGVPSPWHTYQNLQAQHRVGFQRLGVSLDPVFLAPFDINREALRAFQLKPATPIDSVVVQTARHWVGASHAKRLVEIWRHTDRVVAATPNLPLYGGQGFTWYRFWVRPFVPDISKIPESEQRYYLDYMLSIFNNPQNIDFGADALWKIHPTEESAGLVKQFDAEVLPPLEAVVALAKQARDEVRGQADIEPVFVDLHDRLLAYRAFCTTLRNIVAWIAGVHGYLEADNETTRAAKLALVEDMVESELRNAEELLDLWNSSTTDFFPLWEIGETMHTYGTNLGELVERKIELTKRYRNHAPFVDPNYMWRMPKGSELKESDYIEY